MYYVYVLFNHVWSQMGRECVGGRRAKAEGATRGICVALVARRRALTS